jgi:RHS repeat-associated protein
LQGEGRGEGGYDNRNRLIDEERTGANAYHLSYTYDQGGNRLTKIDALHQQETTYHYDLESPATYFTKNNRLMYYQVLDTAGSGNPVLLEEVKYYYGDDYWQDGRKSAPGSPTLIARKRTDENFYRGTLLTYNKQGELWMVAEHVWGVNEDGTPNCDANQRLRVREFGGSGRGRTMVRDRNPNDPGFILTNPLPLWSDYDGDTIYGDYTVTETGDEQSGYTMVLTEKTAYLPGIGQIDYSTTPVSVTYYHADHLGTLRATTDGTGALAAAMVYTAFGEVVATDGTIGGTATAGSRYQYAGDSGYESGLLAGSSDFPSQSWQHVGARWYDPSTGRFLQRDPIGIRGGLNVYEYVSSSPPLQADPQGLTSPLISITDNGRLIGNVTIINPPPGLPRVPWYVLPPGVGLSISCAIFVAQWTSAYIQDTSRALQHPDIFGYPPLPQWYEFWAWGIDDSHLRPGFVWPPPPKPKFDVRDCPIAGSHVCFEAGTWVETAQGGVAIESLEKGMTLMAARSAGLNVEEATLTWAGVSRYTDEVVVIALADEVIRCTRSHPFWVSGRGWVLASELTADDLLQDMQGDSVAVVGVSIDCLTRPTAVYNIKVSGPQCFFVGRHAVLVHTQCSVVPPR